MALVITLIVGYLLLGTKGGRQLCAKAVAKIVSSSLKVLIYIALLLLAGFIAYEVIAWVVSHLLASVLITVLMIIVFVIIGAYCEKKDKDFHAARLAEWGNAAVKGTFTDVEIEAMLKPYALNVFNDAQNPVKYCDGFPFGRITYFLNFFQHDLQDEEPLFFSPVRSKSRDELREYGTVLTTAGMYISRQLDSLDKDNRFKTKDIYLPFSGVIFTKKSSDMLEVYYVKYADKVTLKQEDVRIPLNTVAALFDFAVTSGISRAIYNSQVYDYTAVLDESEAEFIKKNADYEYRKAFEAAGVYSAVPEMEQVYDEVGYNMNQRQGHGAAAEYGNTAIDRITGDFKAEHSGADNVKDGADRVTHRAFQPSVPLQTKYCESASKTIANGFGGEHDYSGMKIEVPRDQYNDCCKILQSKIDKGELADRGIMPGDDARKYLHKGYLTYNQALNVAVAGTVESIMIDTMQGIVCSAGAGSITAILTFANCKWHGADSKEAALQSLKMGAKVMGKSTAVFVLTMQISRKTIINPAHLFNKSASATVQNPLFSASQNLANKISTSALAKSGVGQKIGLNKLDGRKLVSGTVIVVVTFGPDICRALMGRISFKQLVKDSAIGASGLAGAAIGQVMIPIPIVGSIVGGAVSGFIAKKTLDHFIEDDAVEMFAILKEEFMDAVPLANLKQNEFDEVVGMTIAHKKLPSVLRDMYAYGDARAYARDQIMGKAIQHVYSKREVITEEAYNEGLSELAASN